MTLEEDLKNEIKKWANRLDHSLQNTKILTKKGIDFLTNIRAYQSDSLHFYQKGDLIKAYEALIWAWAYLEIGRQMGILAQS
ncbi:MAG: DUF357 domain-containing protein [Candidatus Aenigmarchaeota archaeon]|nr:DUF357 domain-containing protein [Candidatus Aenigmarchaeota archaeon]